MTENSRLALVVGVVVLGVVLIIVSAAFVWRGREAAVGMEEEPIVETTVSSRPVEPPPAVEEPEDPEEPVETIEYDREAIRLGMHNTAVALRMYATDHDGAYPPRVEVLVRDGYLEEAGAPWATCPDLEWHYSAPRTRGAFEVVLYYWPPIDGLVDILDQHGAVAAAEVGTDGKLVHPWSEEVIRPASPSDTR